MTTNEVPTHIWWRQVNMRSHFSAPERRGGTDISRSQSAKGLKGVCAGLAALIVLAAVPVFAQILPILGPPLQDVTFTVTNTNDSGHGSLREAMTLAGPGVTINFDLPLPATIVVSTTLTLPQGVTISGPGSSNLTIAGVPWCNPASCVRTPENNYGDGITGPVFMVNAGSTGTISGMTISGGNGTDVGGGGISNYGTLTLDSVEVSGNRVCDRRWSSAPPCASAARGGGIFNGGALTLINSTVSRNLALGVLRDLTETYGEGGGIYNHSTTGIWPPAPGILTLINSTVSDNVADSVLVSHGEGGGIFNDGGTVTLTNSTVSGNFAFGDSAQGGGIYHAGWPIGSPRKLTVINSTIANNYSGFMGGGIMIAEQYTYPDLPRHTVTLSNSTVSGNFVGCVGEGCVLASGNGPQGPGIMDCCHPLSGGGLTVKNSIIANNTGASPTRGEGNCGRLDAAYSYGHNLSDDASCNFFIPALLGDLISTPAGLDPVGLKNNGGPTQTVALLASSPAVDAVPLSDCTDVWGTPVTTDQRGMQRPQGAACDIGAFEYWQKPARPFDLGGPLLR